MLQTAPRFLASSAECMVMPFTEMYQTGGSANWGQGPDFYLYRLPVAAVTAYQQLDGSKQQQFIPSWF